MSMSLIIPESSPIPHLSFSFDSLDQIIQSASIFNQNLFELLNSNQFSSELQIDLNLTFSKMGLLSFSALQNIEDFFSTGFLGLRITQLNENLLFLNSVLKKHKNYISSLGISFEKLDNIDVLKELLLGLKQQNSLSSLRFALYNLPTPLAEEFFTGITGFSHKITSLTIDFHSSLSSEFQFQKPFWPNFPFIKCLKLIFHEYSVPSVKTIFDGLGALEHMIDFSVSFQATSLNKDLLEGFIANLGGGDLGELKNLSVEVFNEIESENIEKLLEVIEKKSNKLEGLRIGFNKNANFSSIGLNQVVNFIEGLEKKEKLMSFGLSLMENNLIGEPELNKLGEAFGKLGGLRSFELNLTNNKIPGNLTALLLNNLENLKEKLRSLKLFVGWNMVSDEFGREIFKIIEKFTNLEYFLCDMSQNYSGSHYMNGALATDFTDCLSKLTNLKTLLVNLEGNEFKENHYCDFETNLTQWKTEEKMPFLEFFKVFRKSEIYGLSQNEPNLSYFEDFMQHFPRNYGFTQEYRIAIPNLSFEFNECCFENSENINLFNKFIKNLKVKTSNENVALTIRNPPPIEGDLNNKCPLKEIFGMEPGDNNVKKSPYAKVLLGFSSFLQNPEKNPLNIKFPINKDKFDEFKTSETTLNYLANFNQNSMTNLLENSKKFEFFAQNKLVSHFLQPKKFEEFYKMIPAQNTEKQSIFVNFLFKNSLIYDFFTKLPGFLASTEEYSRKLTPEVLSLLNFYSKTLKLLPKDSLAVHEKKIASFESLLLKNNHNFSIKTWKMKIFNDFHKAWTSSHLKTPKDFTENAFFEVFPSKKHENDEEIKGVINEKYEEFKALFEKMEFQGLNSYYQGFLEDLIGNLPNLKKIDFGELINDAALKKKFQEGLGENEEKKGDFEEKKDEKIEKIGKNKENEESGKKLNVIEEYEDLKENEEVSSYVGEGLKSQDLILDEKPKDWDEPKEIKQENEWDFF